MWTKKYIINVGPVSKKYPPSVMIKLYIIKVTFGKFLMRVFEECLRSTDARTCVNETDRIYCMTSWYKCMDGLYIWGERGLVSSILHILIWWHDSNWNPLHLSWTTSFIVPNKMIFSFLAYSLNSNKMDNQKYQVA